MDEFDAWHIRADEARSENRNSILAGEPDRIVSARQRYDELLAEYHEIYQKHIERARVKRWMLTHEDGRSNSR